MYNKCTIDLINSFYRGLLCQQDMVQKSYDIAYGSEDCEVVYLEELISCEKNQELKIALQD